MFWGWLFPKQPKASKAPTKDSCWQTLDPRDLGPKIKPFQQARIFVNSLRAPKSQNLIPETPTF